MKDIKVVCRCGKEMVKSEDGREGATKHNSPDFPSNQMDFICPCGKKVTVVWLETDQNSRRAQKQVSGMSHRENENLD